jgi:hypothetical protein
MARVKKGDPAQCQLLSLWQPPPKAGDPVGVLATTFTLDTALFEEECLARFADVQSDPLRDGALYRIEREEKLASLKCAAVIADIHHCVGRRSLRWDLLAARPKSGVMHAKLSLLAWSEHVRIIVASSNLTNDGYRRNQECVAAIDFDDGFSDRALLDPLLAYFRDLLAITSGPAQARAEGLLNWVDGRIPKEQVTPARGLQRRVILLGPNRKNFFEQLAEMLPGEPPEQAHVVSPFFDPDLRENGPENSLWGLMKKRGTAEVHFHVAGEASPETNGWRLEVPEHVLNATPKGRGDVATRLHPILVAGVPTDTGPERRPLHAKTLMLSHEKWSALVIGSSNFTSAGMGLNAYARNYEANLVCFLRTPASDSLRKALETRALRGGPAVVRTPSTIFAPAFDPDSPEGDAPPPLPVFFGEAALDSSGDTHYELTLTFVLPSPEGEWAIRLDQSVILTSSSWRSQLQPTSIHLSLPRSGPPPSVLTVEWANGAHVVDWPVNVSTADALPAPDELKGLSLAALLELLSSARPLHEALRAWLRRQPDDDDSNVELAIELIDPHAKVDSSGFMVKRVQRACWAMQSLRARLEQPVLSSSAMAWRIKGPVGAYAMLEAMQRQCDPKLPDEWTFLLCELWRELAAVPVKGGGGRAPEPESLQMMEGLIGDLHERLMNALPQCTDAMRTYVVDAMSEANNAAS